MYRNICKMYEINVLIKCFKMKALLNQISSTPMFLKLTKF